MPTNHFDATCDGRVRLDPVFLKRLRQLRGLSQNALADACAEHRLCLSLASIKRAEAGKSVLYRTARHFATFYRTDMDLLLGQAKNASRAGREQHVQQASPATHDRRRRAADLSVIHFNLSRHDFNAAAQQHVIDAGARAVASVVGSEFAVVFPAPAHRCADVLTALRCAIRVNACTDLRSDLVLRRCASAAVFTRSSALEFEQHPGTAAFASNSGAANRQIYVESTLATQLATLAQFDVHALAEADCWRFLCLRDG
jgi:transcriptional regulator with XRE-family HTH domain